MNWRHSTGITFLALGVVFFFTLSPLLGIVFGIAGLGYLLMELRPGRDDQI